MKLLRRRMGIIFALILLFALTLTGTFAWQSVSQQTKNEARSEPETATVELYKLESGTEVPLAGAWFLLYRADGTQVGGASATDADGKITLSLPVGDYYFEEWVPAPDHGFALDDDGSTVKKEYSFAVSKENVESGWPVRVTVQDPRLTGALRIIKTVENADGAPLTTWQTAQDFTFTVTFSDGGSYEYSVLDEEQNVVESAKALTAEGTLTLRHGQMAVFDRVPAGVAYTVTETPVPGYAIRSSGHTGKIAAKGALAEFWNRYQRGGLEISKTVVNEDGSAPDPDQEFPFIVSFSDGKTYEYSILGGDGAAPEVGSLTSGGTLVLKHGQRALFSYLPAGVTYTVIEEAVPGYRHTQTFYTGEIVKGATAHADFENRYGEEPDAPGSLTVTKQIQSEDGSEPTAEQREREFTFEVTFLDAESHSYTIYDADDAIQGSDVITGRGSLVLRHGWRVVFPELPRGTTYSVAEEPMADYRALPQSTGGTIQGGAAAKVRFLNIPTEPMGQLILSKLVEGAYPEEDEGRAFDFTVTFSEGGPYDYSIMEGSTTVSEGVLASGGVLTLEHGQSAIFSALPAGVIYTVTEADYAGYRPLIINGYGTVEGGEIVATAVNAWPEILISGTKTWELNGRTDGVMPRYIWVKLYQGDTLIQRLQVKPDSAGSWDYSFIVPRDDVDGNELAYRVEEEPVAHFKAEYEPGTYNILNRYDPTAGPDPTPTPHPGGGDDGPDSTPKPTPTPGATSTPNSTQGPSPSSAPGTEPTTTPASTPGTEPSSEPTLSPGGEPTPTPPDSEHTPPSAPPSTQSVPKTGDERRPGLWLALCVVSLLGLSCCLWYACSHHYHGKRVQG